jgi:formate hydrogenlyase transcriptional activator
MIDISKHKQAEEELRESEEHFRILVEQASDVIAIADANGRWIDVNSAIVDMLGYTREEFLQHAVGANVVAEEKARVATELAGLEGGQTVLTEFRVRRKDGSVVPVEVSVKRLPDGRLQMIGRDMTERKRAEEALRESEERFRSLYENSTIGIYRTTPDGRVLLANPSLVKMLGFSSFLELSQRNLQEEGFEPGHERAEFQRRLNDEGQVIGLEASWTRKDGTPIFVRESAKAIRNAEGKVTHYEGTVEDITERKQAEALVALQKETLEAIARGVPLKESLTTLVRVMESQWPGLVGSVLLLEEDGLHVRHGAAPSLPEAYIKAIDGAAIGPSAGSCGTAMYRKEPVIVTDVMQSPLWNDYRDLAVAHGVRACWSTPILSAEAKVLGSFAMYYAEPRGPSEAEMRLIEVATHLASIAIERKRAEEALQTSEERFRVALKHSPISVFSQDRDLRYTWIYNFAQLLPNEALGKTDEEIIGVDKARRLRELKQQVSESRTGVREEITIPHKGKTYAYDITLEPLFDATGGIVGITGAAMDIARLRELADSLQKAQDRLVQEKRYLESEIETELGFEKMIGQSPALRQVLKDARVVAPTDSTVLLLGETGTGKELVARAIHALSGRQDKNFIKLNCAAVPTGLLESELFGHEKGAFTGAVNQKIGRLELADKGTLFLDEIGELPLELQPKLLRVLQDREFERLGGVRTLRVDVRIISATNRDLRKDVTEKNFREDLFYRLNVFPITLPSLRERRSDIPVLVHHFVEKHAARMGKHIETIPDETMSVLQNWIWPGNIRELENLIERMVILTKGPVLAPPPLELDGPQELMLDKLTEMERDHIIRVLRETNGVLSGADGASNRLGIKRTTLQSMLKRFGIDPQEFRGGTGTFGRD